MRDVLIQIFYNLSSHVYSNQNPHGLRWISEYENSEPFTTQSQLSTTLRKRPFENFTGKGENAGNQHFTLIPIMFSILPKTNFSCSVTLILLSASAFNGPV